MKLKPYPEYKESGVEWIGEIPKDWEIKKLKHFTENLDGKRIPISAEQRISGSIPYYGATGVVDYVDDYIFDEELLLIGEDGAPFFDPYKDVSFIIEGKSWVNNHAHVLRVLEGINIKILMNQLNQTDYAYFIKGSTRDKLNQDQLKEIPIIQPPEDVQSRIILFLNKKTSEIDLTIEKDTRLIELLQEKRTALINHVVTKGLDPSVKMKDSGVEWIGKIPQTYELTKLDKFTELITDYVANGSFSSLRKNVTYKDEEDYAILLRLVDNSNKFKGPFVYIDEHAYRFLSKTKLFPGDIILSNVGATLGTIFRAPDLDKPMSLAPNVLLIRAKNRIYSDYLYYWLNSSRGQFSIKTIVTETTQPKFNKTNFRKLPMLLPTIEEQEKIVNFIENENQIKLTIKKIQKNIELLEEYKKSLIHHVVTGKVDLREVAV